MVRGAHMNTYTVEGQRARRTPIYVYIPDHMVEWASPLLGVSKSRARKALADAYIHFGAYLGWGGGESLLAITDAGTPRADVTNETNDEYDPEGYIAKLKSRGTEVYTDPSGRRFDLAWTWGQG
jgi:hypothetical protein